MHKDQKRVLGSILPHFSTYASEAGSLPQSGSRFLIQAGSQQAFCLCYPLEAGIIDMHSLLR